MTTTTWHPQYFFSAPQPTIEAAQALHSYELFNCAAIFQTPDGAYVYGQIREMDSPPYKTARVTKDTVGYTMVSYHGALLDVWQAFPPKPKTYFVHLDATAITLTTNGESETMKFRTKKQADKKLLELMKDGYTFDRVGWAAHQAAFSTSNPDYAPTPDALF